MENLFFLLVLAIIIIANIVRIQKKIKEESAGESASGQPGQSPGIKDVVARIKSELEQASEQPVGDKGQSTGWEAVVPGYGDGRQPGQAETAGTEPAEDRKAEKSDDEQKIPVREKSGQTRMDSLKQRGQTPEARMDRANGEKAVKKKAAENPRRQTSVVTQTRPMGAAETAASIYGSPARRRGRRLRRWHSAGQLRNAVVWSEILGRPVGLRKQGEQIWM